MKYAGELIAKVAAAAAESGIDIMLIGAFARDYWIERFELKGRARATLDIDFACQVMTWRDFECLINSLTGRYALTADPRNRHKLWFDHELSLDLVPCGGIAGDNGKIVWPPEFDTELCVLGYDVAKNHAPWTVIGDSRVRVIAPHWLVLLKLQSYAENPSSQRERDLQDAYFLINNYFDCIDVNFRLFETDAIDRDVLAADDFDSCVAGATLIGRDCGRDSCQITAQIMRNLANHNRQDNLTVALARTAGLKADLAKRIIAELCVAGDF